MPKIGALLEDGDFSQEGAILGRFCGRRVNVRREWLYFSGGR